MRIPSKMTLALSATGLVLFGAYAVYLVHAEDEDLRATIVREAQMLGHSLQTAIADALRDRQMADVQELLVRLDKVEQWVDIMVYDQAGALQAQSPGSLATQALEGRAALKSIRTGKSFLTYDHPADPKRLVLALPMRLEHRGIIGAIVLARPLDDLRADIARTRRDAATSVALFVLAATLIGLILGRVYLGAPMSGLVSAMRRVREGDLASHLPVRRKDEIGEAAKEFNVMVTELQEVRQRLAEEASRRQALEHGLQEADKLITIGQLAASVAHEIGSPLQVLVGRAHALAEHDYDVERVRRSSEIIARQGERITGIVEQLMTYARRRPPRTILTDLREPVRAVLDLLAIEGKKQGIAISLTAPDDVPVVPCDSNRIQQVVFNLLRNALNATPKGGHVSVELARAPIDDLPGRTGKTPGVVLAVEDDGSGIAPENLQRVFEPFYTTRAEAGGVGLGLAVVKAIVAEHGGRVSATSDLGKGSRFLVELPVGSEGIVTATQAPKAVQEGAA